MSRSYEDQATTFECVWVIIGWALHWKVTRSRWFAFCTAGKSIGTSLEIPELNYLIPNTSLRPVRVRNVFTLPPGKIRSISRLVTAGYG